MPESSATPDGLAKLAHRIGDYSGYENAESRASSDKAIRDQVIHNIDALLQQLDGDFKAADKNEQQQLDSLIAGAKRKLSIICDSLAEPTYLQGRFFGMADINRERLQRIYELEWNMLEETDNIKEELLLLKDNIAKEVFEDHFLHIGNFVDDINQALFEREALIVGDA